MVRDRIDQFNERFANSDTGTRSLDSIPRGSNVAVGLDEPPAKLAKMVPLSEHRIRIDAMIQCDSDKPRRRAPDVSSTR
jgi:hypothetical protein